MMNRSIVVYEFTPSTCIVKHKQTDLYIDCLLDLTSHAIDHPELYPAILAFLDDLSADVEELNASTEPIHSAKQILMSYIQNEIEVIKWIQTNHPTGISNAIEPYGYMLYPFLDEQRVVRHNKVDIHQRQIASLSHAEQNTLVNVSLLSLKRRVQFQYVEDELSSEYSSFKYLSTTLL
jgi:hypothetical protein